MSNQKKHKCSHPIMDIKKEWDALIQKARELLKENGAEFDKCRDERCVESCRKCRVFDENMERQLQEIFGPPPE